MDGCVDIEGCPAEACNTDDTEAWCCNAHVDDCSEWHYCGCRRGNQQRGACFNNAEPARLSNRRAKTEAQKKPESSSSYETDSESDEESSASEESPVKAQRPSDNSELMNRFRSRLQASGSRSPPKRYASDSD